MLVVCYHYNHDNYIVNRIAVIKDQTNNIHVLYNVYFNHLIFTACIRIVNYNNPAKISNNAVMVQITNNLHDKFLTVAVHITVAVSVSNYL